MKTARRLWVVLPALAVLAACGNDNGVTTDATGEETPAATATSSTAPSTSSSSPGQRFKRHRRQNGPNQD